MENHHVGLFLAAKPDIDPIPTVGRIANPSYAAALPAAALSITKGLTIQRPGASQLTG